jgi:hypothetical protein
MQFLRLKVALWPQILALGPKLSPKSGTGPKSGKNFHSEAENGGATLKMPLCGATLSRFEAKTSDLGGSGEGGGGASIF